MSDYSNFGKMEDGILLLHSLVPFYFFHFQKPLSKWRQRYVKNGLHGKRLFVKKAPNFVQFESSDFMQILPACGINI